MCEDQKVPIDQMNLAPISERYDDLIPSSDYTLSVVYLQQVKKYQVELTGEAVDNQASNLPVEIQNTILSPLGEV